MIKHPRAWSDVPSRNRVWLWLRLRIRVFPSRWPRGRWFLLGPEFGITVGKLLGDVRRFRAKSVEIAFRGEIGLASDLIGALCGLFAFDFAEAAAPIEQ